MVGSAYKKSVKPTIAKHFFLQIVWPNAKKAIPLHRF